ncbi:MAG: bifunctional 3-(3-hydroxy-phenyl)propionate/3-hydroxycinnamic acid hydroxylase, partial [Myxococcota bacterium]|nr:bifunctional 3-(3-hydroxy-phenyl)propionate/3-hydroxycinnamic acid hydroxylase [Myxococcota bacterium]
MADFDVAIIGYGPVGVMGAYVLADAGLRVVVIESETEIVDIPRAVNLDGEIIRAYQRLGHGEEIEAQTQPLREGDAVAFVNSKHEPYFQMPLPASGDNGYRDLAFMDQPELEATLRALVEDQKSVTLQLGREALAIEVEPGQVWLQTQSSQGGDPQRISASYLIGCDGASSFVREQMGIRWDDLGYDQDWLVVDIVVDDTRDLTNLTMQVCDPARLSTYVCVKDPNRRWEFQMLPGETREEMLRPEKIEVLLSDWIEAGRYSIRRSAVYQFHAALAAQWRVGRVFLAGDAAHQTPPFLGQGLNTGFRDVINLGWKLPLVFEGVSEESLLDSYMAERGAHARDFVEWAVALGKLMENFAAGEAGEPPPHEVDPSSGYGQGRAAPPLSAGVIMTEQIGAESSTGYLLRQPTLRGGDGQVFRMDELLGRGFAVVAREASGLALSSESQSVLDRIGAKTVSLAGLEVSEGSLDPALENGSALIVRPDRYVFGVVDEKRDLDALIASLA